MRVALKRFHRNRLQHLERFILGIMKQMPAWGHFSQYRFEVLAGLL